MTGTESGQRAFFVLAVGLLIVGSILAARLLLVNLATPASLWVDEFTPITAAGDPAIAGPIADGLSPFVNDPSMIRTRLMECTAVEYAIGEDSPCLAIVDEGLALVPTSSELWLLRARLLARNGIFEEPFVESIRNAYATGPHEGWLAATRLPFALQMRIRLPEDMMDLLGADLVAILENQDLAQPLVFTYIADPFLRESTWEFIQRYASLDQQERLISWIRSAI